MRALYPLLVVGLLIPLAGCIEAPVEEIPTEGESGDSSDDVYAAVQARLAGVPCTVDNVGTGTSENLVDLGLIGFEHGGGTASLDFRDGIMIAATTGMGIIDIRDPLAPVVLSVFGEHGYGDVKISPDGYTAIGGAGGMIELVDIRDPTDPTLVGEWSLASAGHPNQGFLNAHMIYTALIAEEQWVFVAANNNDGVWILKLTGPPEERALEFVTTTLPVQGGPLGPHDMWVTHDETADRWLLYSADGYHGWSVFDISDPAEPTFAGGVVLPQTGYTHTIQAGWVGERRLVATIAEVGVNILHVYDATNLMAPVLLATWHVNVEPGTAPQPAAPQHEFNIVNGSLYMGHYANGFYIFDLAAVPTTAPLIGTADLRPVAHYAVSNPGPTTLFSHIWSVDVINGVLFASSMDDGIHVVGYGCNKVGDPLLTSTG